MKQRIISGIQPSGDLHIGNYLGAIAQWSKLADEYEVMIFIADLHAITVPQKPEELHRRTIEIAKIYLASGIDPSQITIFVQSQIREHTELCWILNTITRNGELTKMTQFKDKAGMMDMDEFESRVTNVFQGKFQESFRDAISKGGSDNEISSIEQLSKLVGEVSEFIIEKFQADIKEPFNSCGVGLFDYPVLMAGDIMLYDAEFVPVGDDQVQHIELARVIGRRFNKRFGEEILSMPRPILQEFGARIMALDNPLKKMSKSAQTPNSFIALMDDPDLARKKIMRAVTDSGKEIVYSDDKPALKNLITIYALLTDKKTSEIEQLYVGKGYADFKTDLADIVAKFLEEFQAKYREISDEEVMRVLHEGAQKARPLAQKKMVEVRKLMGFVV